jgi:hypothetical protein
MRSRGKLAQARWQSGIGMIEILIASALGLAALLVMTRVITGSLNISKKATYDMDVSALRGYLVDRVSCPSTLSATTPRCTPNSYIALNNAAGKAVIPAGGTTIGQLFVRARCTPSGLDVRAAALSESGKASNQAKSFNGKSKDEWFLRDGSGGTTTLSWDHPKSTLFAPGRTELCGHMFGTKNNAAAATKGCGNNQIIRRVDFYNNRVECLPMPPNCPKQTALSWQGGSFTCVPSSADSAIRDNLIVPAIEANNTKIEKAPSLCVVASRAGGGSLSGGGGFVSAIDSGSSWGMRCNPPYAYFTCHLAGSTSAKNTPVAGGSYADWDIWPETNGCSADDEERAGASVLSITCCKPGDPSSVP